MTIVSKFGGTSLATREQFEKVAEIIGENPEREYIVVSAPGKQNSADTKITDLLIQAAQRPREMDSLPIQIIRTRIESIMSDAPHKVQLLNAELNLRVSLNQPAALYADSLKAFGEYASAHILEHVLQKRGIDAKFVDPRSIGFNVRSMKGEYLPDPACFTEMGRRLEALRCANPGARIIIPGFYAYTVNDELVTLPRGGSDTTQAVVGNAVNAALCENWTDEDGLRRADPRIISNPAVIPEMTYDEARELAYLGFKLQPDSLTPLIERNIPLRVLNTNNISSPGTLVVAERITQSGESIAGVAAKVGYRSLTLAKPGMNREVGFGRKVYAALEELEIPYEHSPTGIDTMSVIVEDVHLRGTGKLNTLDRRIQEAVGPLELSVGKPMAIVAVVGQNMRSEYDIESRVLGALASEKIRPWMINQGYSDIGFFIGIDESRADHAVRTIYKEFYG